MELSKIPYQNAIGTLMYLLHATRPDIAYAVSYLYQFNLSYNATHWQYLKNLMRYLKGTAHLGLTFYKDKHNHIFGFCDASYGTGIKCESFTGYIFLKQGGAISWRSRKQHVMARSSTESELQSLDGAVTEALYLRKIEKEILLLHLTPTLINCDNKSILEFSKNLRFSHALKHVNIKFNAIKQNIELKDVHLQHLPSNQMLADPLTKGVGKEKIVNFNTSVGLL